VKASYFAGAGVSSVFSFVFVVVVFIFFLLFFVFFFVVFFFFFSGEVVVVVEVLSFWSGVVTVVVSFFSVVPAGVCAKVVETNAMLIITANKNIDTFFTLVLLALYCLTSFCIGLHLQCQIVTCLQAIDITSNAFLAVIPVIVK
jgi:hypothetical protein